MRNNVYLQAFLVWGAAIGLMLSGILAMGCSSPAPAAVKSHKALAAAIIATEGEGAAPAPSPSPSGKCDNCNGKGKVGDGTVMVDCPVCGGDGVKEGASCPCGDACECEALKKELAAKDAKLAEMEAITARLENNAQVLAGEIDALKYAEPTPVKVNGRWYKSHEGETVVYDDAGKIWRYVAQAATKPKKVQAPDPYMSPCGPGGCPTPSAGGFGIFGRRR
jgi:hypothetical protein